METPVVVQTVAAFRAVPKWLVELLNRRGTPYDAIYHQRDGIALEAAQDTGTKNLEFAKTVILDADAEIVMAVLPANHQVDLELVAKVLNASRVELVSKHLLHEMFPDSEIGAEPPFGEHYGTRVIISAAMAADEHITFNAGSHRVAIHMRFADYQSIVKPVVAHFSVREFRIP